jgi:predicted outer membrane protein
MCIMRIAAEGTPWIRPCSDRHVRGRPPPRRAREHSRAGATRAPAAPTRRGGSRGVADPVYRTEIRGAARLRPRHIGCNTPGMRVHLLLCIAIAGGCADATDNDTGSSADSANHSHGDLQAKAIELGNTRGRGLVALARGELLFSSNADWLAKTFAIMAALNAGEIAQAELILSVTTDPEVRDLASEIKTDHEANEVMLEQLMQAHGVAPLDNGVTRTVQAEADMGISQLEADPPSLRDIDYVQMQVTMHQEASLLLADMRDYPMPPDVQAFVASTLPAILEHLAHAEAVLQRLL